ncbi:MAG: LuxR C-terminal-related transcriptional regulator [Chloroflexia bacterium]
MREREVLRALCAGRSNAEVATHLSISERTVQFHLGNIYSKLGLAELEKAVKQRELGTYCPLLDSLDYLAPDSSAPAESESFQLDDTPSLPVDLRTQPVSMDLPVEPLTAEAGTVPFPAGAGVLPEAATRRIWRPSNLRGVVIVALSLLAVLASLWSGMLLRTDSGELDVVTPSPTVAASASETVPVIALASTASPTSKAVSVCGEAGRVTAPATDRFVRHQGVSSFTVENTQGAVWNNKVRSLTVDRLGLWIGYFATDQNESNGVGHYDKKTWANCNQPLGVELLAGTNINAIKVDKQGQVWTANEKGGVSMFDGSKWHTYTTDDGLPTNETFGLTIDEADNAWVATWEGVAKYDAKSKRWSVPYTVEDGTIFNNHIGAIAFGTGGDIWVGHLMQHGVSHYRASEGKWLHYTTETGELVGNDVFSIAVRPPDSATGSQESIWIGTDNGVTRFEGGTWTSYRMEDGLPGNMVEAVAIDPFNRIWVATTGGVAYLRNGEWTMYTTTPSHSIGFGPDCTGCPFDGDHVWVGTDTSGLTHSRIPLTTTDVIDVISVEYPKIVAPSQKFRVEITLSPRAPYQLREDRGDFVANTDESDANLFGAWRQMPVKGIVEPGQRFTFTDYDKPFVAPQLAEGEQERTFTSTWRVWMFTRYVGPPIPITFTVRKPSSTPVVPQVASPSVSAVSEP